MHAARVNGMMEGIHRMSSAVRMEDLANMVNGSTMKLSPSNKASMRFWSPGSGPPSIVTERPPSRYSVDFLPLFRS